MTGRRGPKGDTGDTGKTGATGPRGLPSHITLTRRLAVIVALCLALAGGIGAGLVGLAVGPRIFSEIEDNRQAIRVSCHLLNRAINQSQAAGGESTALLVAEIVEGMTPSERHAYQQAAANAATAGPQKNTCGRVADNAY
jgi:hypothetical protein